MRRYCGEFRVARRVQAIIREEDGSLLTLKNPCIVLEDVVGTGKYLGFVRRPTALLARGLARAL